jgi:hypothetical protein
MALPGPAAVQDKAVMLSRSMRTLFSGGHASFAANSSATAGWKAKRKKRKHNDSDFPI